MPYKHQSNCYRTIGGVRWPNFCDMHDAHEEQNVAEAKAEGARFVFRKHAHGFQQAFIHPDDLAAYIAKHSKPEDPR